MRISEVVVLSTLWCSMKCNKTENKTIMVCVCVPRVCLRNRVRFSMWWVCEGLLVNSFHSWKHQRGLSHLLTAVFCSVTLWRTALTLFPFCTVLHHLHLYSSPSISTFWTLCIHHHHHHRLLHLFVLILCLFCLPVYAAPYLYVFSYLSIWYLFPKPNLEEVTVYSQKWKRKKCPCVSFWA
jgi:hypothetical protein